jgi:voltage-gated potassium channel
MAAGPGKAEATASEYLGAPPHGHAYNIFILVLTVISLVVMVLLLLPLNDATITLLVVYDNVICAVFLVDFAMNLSRAKSKRHYFIDQRGWLDLVGSIPALPDPRAARFASLFRLARLSRMARILRLLRGRERRQLVDDVLRHRSQYAAFLTVLIAGVVLLTSTLVVVNAEGRSEEASIRSGGDALWWSLVTITTVGYGDFFPVTTVGRIAAAFVMIMGIGVIGALASILASVLVGDSSAAEEPGPAASPDVQGELAALTGEVAALRALVEQLDRRLAGAARADDVEDRAPG